MKLIFHSSLPNIKFQLFLLILSLISITISATSPENLILNQHKWKVEMVQDLDGYPAYETNGLGPRHSENSPRFSELQSQEPPHPQMPDEEPAVLLEMEEKIAALMGIPHKILGKDSNISSSIESLSKSSLQNHLIEQDFRFAQIDSESHASVKGGSISRSTWDTIEFNSAWASSVYTYSWWYYYHSYPASNAIKGWSYWCSTGGHSADQVITWQGDFERPRRIAYLWLRWAYAPGYLSIQTTADGKTWEERVPWREAARGKVSALRRLFSWWGWWAQSYAEEIYFDDPIWVTGVRILMKDPMYYYFGLYHVKVWTKQWVVQLKSGASQESDDCLTLRNGQYNNGEEILVRNCIEAISQGDARELFVIQNNLQLTSYRQDLCVESSGGQNDDNSRIQLYNCYDTNNAGDQRDRWYLDPKGFIKYGKNQDRCLSIIGNEIEWQSANGYSVSIEATSTLNDGQHEAKMAIDGSDDSYWASQPGVEQTQIKIMFNTEQTVKEVNINWKYIPADFELMVFMNGYWRSFGSEKANSKEENKISIGSKSIAGLKIMMTKAGESSKFNDKCIFGIKSIKIKSATRKVGLRDCSADDQNNKWFIDDSNWVDQSTRPSLNSETQKLYQNTNRLLDLIHILLNWPPTIQLMIGKAKTLATTLSKIEADISDFDLRLEQFKAQNLAEEEQEAKQASTLGAIGSSSNRPGASCAVIKQTFPYKMTGYYWIKSECSKIPIRSFCDYSSFENGIDYAYYGGLGNANMKGGKVKNIDDIRYQCAKLGLYPVELRKKEQIESIRKYLVDIGVSLDAKGLIPLGYDYGCDTGTCTGKYLSLNSRSTKDFTDVLKNLIDKNNIKMQSFSQGFHGKPDYLIGFGLSNKGVMTSKFDSGIPIKGIVCSSNIDPTQTDNQWVQIDCDTKARGNNDFDSEKDTNIKVICPGGCLNSGNGKVVGVEVFTDDSLICKAAIHNGVLNAENGGKIEVGIEAGRDSYQGSDSNGIKSEAFDDKWDRSIVINKYHIKCPIDNYSKRKTASFLELEETITDEAERGIGGLANSLTKGVNSAKTAASNAFSNAGKKVNSVVKKAESAAGTLASKVSNAVETGKNAVSNAVETGKNELNSAVDAVSDAVGGGDSNAGSNTESSQNQAAEVSNNDSNGGGADTGAKDTKIDSTEEAIEKLIGYFSQDKTDITKQIRLVKDSSTLLNKLSGEYGSLVSTSLSPDQQSTYMDTLSTHIKGSNLEMNKAIVRAEAKLKKKHDKWTKLSLEKMKYQRFDPYEEQYKLKIFDLYELYDFVQASDKPSKWEFTKSSLNGHANAIGQTSNIQILGDIKQRYASHLKLKYKSYYDGKLRVSVLGKAQGRIGIAFRYLDAFNFYVFEMERGIDGVGGYKRIRKFVNGEPTELAIVKDGGFLQDKWYRILIKFEVSKISVNMEEENDQNVHVDFEEKMPQVLQAFDGDFAEGGFAFMINAMSGVYFDKFSISSTQCIDQSIVKDQNSYLPATCSRFKESFFTDLSFVWKTEDPESNKNGPSFWEYKKDYNGRREAVHQGSLISGSDSNRLPAILSLKLEKICKYGIIQTEFYAENKEGYVGVAFHYKNAKNYFIFEVYGGEKQKFCQVRKIIDGSAKVVQKTDDDKCGYIAQKWYSLTIKLSDSDFVFYLSKENEGLTEVLKISSDLELSHGSIALASFGVKVGFANIKTMPREDIELNIKTEVKEVKVNEEKPKDEVQPEIKDSGSKNGKTQADKTAEFEGCLDKKTPIEREKYCLAKFTEDKSAQNDCKNNFCDRCCDDNIDAIHTVKRFKCKRDCTVLGQTDKSSDEWELCIASPKPQLSVYQYCETNQNSEVEKSRCKVDFCKLCCATSNDVFKKKFADSSIQKCQKKCLENFGENQKDIIVSTQL